MMKLLSFWKPFSLIYYIGIFIYFIIYQHQPFHSLLLPYLLFFVITRLIFIGNTIGSFGLYLHIITRDESKARPYYELAFKLKTTKVNILASYALMLLKDGFITEAQAIYNRLLTFRHLSPSLYKIIHSNLAICAWKLGYLTTAIADYEKVFNHETYQEFLTADDYTTLGYLYIEQENWDKALAFTEKALELDETHPSALDNLGQLHYRQGTTDRAIAYFNQALEIKDSLVDSHFWLGKIYEDNQENEKALHHYEAALNGNISSLNTVDRQTIENSYHQVLTKKNQ